MFNDQTFRAISIIISVLIGFGISLLLQKRSQKKLQDEIIKQGLADNRTISRIYLGRYIRAMKMKQKSKAKQAIELNYMHCPYKTDDCLKRKFCPGCVADIYGWADANVEFNERDIKDE